MYCVIICYKNLPMSVSIRAVIFYSNIDAVVTDSFSCPMLQEVILQKRSPSDKFGLTLCYRPSDAQQNLTEVFISEVSWYTISQWSFVLRMPCSLIEC